MGWLDRFRVLSPKAAAPNDYLSNTAYDFRIQYNDCNSTFVPLKVEDISPRPHEDVEMSACLELM
jgi:hypothetical protein